MATISPNCLAVVAAARSSEDTVAGTTARGAVTGFLTQPTTRRQATNVDAINGVDFTRRL